MSFIVKIIFLKKVVGLKLSLLLKLELNIRTSVSYFVLRTMGILYKKHLRH